MSKTKYELGIWDWKADPYDDLEKLLKKLGVHMYELPSFEGSDMYGFIFSNKKLTEEEIKNIDVEENEF